MKRTHLVLLLITTITSICLAQSTDTIYFNKKWKVIPKEKNYKYFRIMKKENDSLYRVSDYYKEGQLQMTGAFKSAEQKEKLGKFIWYSKEGEQTSSKHYQYDQTNDTIKEYLLNKYKELKLLDTINIVYEEFSESDYTSSGLIVNGKNYGLWKSLNKKKELSFTQEYSNNEDYVETKIYYNSDYNVNSSAYGNIWYTGHHINNKKDSTWTYYFPDKSIEKKVNYKNGKEIEEVSFIGLGDWYLLKSYECGFKIEFPKEPTTTSNTNTTRDGDIKTTGFLCDESKAKNTRNLIYLVKYLDPQYAIFNFNDKVASSNLFKKSIENSIEKFGELISEKEIELKGYLGKEIKMKSKSGKELTTMRVYLVENRVVMIGTITNIKSKFDASTNRFFDSFDFINNI